MAVHAAFEEINNKCLTKVWVSGQLKCNQVCPLYSNLLFWKVHVKLLSAFCPFQVFHFKVKVWVEWSVVSVTKPVLCNQDSGRCMS